VPAVLLRGGGRRERVLFFTTNTKPANTKPINSACSRNGKRLRPKRKIFFDGKESAEKLAWESRRRRSCLFKQHLATSLRGEEEYTTITALNAQGSQSQKLSVPSQEKQKSAHEKKMHERVKKSTQRTKLWRQEGRPPNI